MNQQPDEQTLARLFDSRLRDASGALDPNLIAAYVDGGLSPSERLAMERRLAADPEARLLARTLRDGGTNRSVIWIPVLSLAALVLVGVLLWTRTSDTGSGLEAVTPVASLDDRLATVVASVRAERPEQFGDFAMLSDDELTTGGIQRGSGAWVSPRGVVLEAPKTLAWKCPKGSKRVKVTLRGQGVSWVKEIEGCHIKAPALAPGRYVVTLRALDALAGQTLRRSFVVASPGEREDYASAIAALRAKSPDDLAELLVAHYAMRQRLFDIAQAATKLAVKQGGKVQEAAEKLAAHLKAISGR